MHPRHQMRGFLDDLAAAGHDTTHLSAPPAAVDMAQHGYEIVGSAGLAYVISNNKPVSASRLALTTAFVGAAYYVLMITTR